MQREKLKSRFLKRENSGLQLFKNLEQADEALLKRKIKTGKWNILQIVWHLNSSDHLTVNYMLKKMQGGNAVPVAGIRSAAGSYALKVALRYLKWKKPPVLPDPPEELELNDLKNEWNRNSQQLESLINSLPDDMMIRKIFRHPLAGRMNIFQALEFMLDHFNHHLRQINKLLQTTDLISN